MILLLAAAVAMASSGCHRAPRDLCEGCNVVLVSIDTARADHVGAYGYRRPTTPSLDAFAEESVLFENAISQSSWTRAAHMSIMTGLHPNKHGFVGLNDHGRLDSSVPTLASTLRRHGYTTVGFTGGVNVAAAYGFDLGFDVYRSNGRNFRDNLEEARYWLDELASEPFFLFWHGYDAHTPYTSDPIDRAALHLPARRTRVSLERICRKKWPGGRIRHVIDEYDASLHHADRYVAKLLAELKRRGLLERTVVVVVSDHGEEFLDHGACFHLNTLYHEVLHVPFLVRVPGAAPRRVAALVPASVSVGRTILDLVGIADSSLPGYSLVPLMGGGSAPVEPVISETRHRLNAKGGRGHLRSVTLTEEKLIDWITLHQREWFDLRSDPGEHAPRLVPARASERLADWLAKHPDNGPPHTAEASRIEHDSNAETQRDLRALGYVD